MNKKWFILLLYVFIAAWLMPSVISAAGFDCSEARTKTEKAICGDPVLSKLDEDMAAAYRKASGAADTHAVKKAQIKWIKETQALCIEDKACIKEAYEKRLHQLETSSISNRDRISAAKSIEETTKDYSGKYIRKTNNNESAQMDIRKTSKGNYHITGLATWGNKEPWGPNIGELDFYAVIKKSKIHYSQYKGMRKGKKEYYVLDIIINKKGLAVKEKNALGLFGMNVYFSGEYIKK